MKATNEKPVSIYQALADFQQECPVIHKGTSGYGYSYADLPTIFSIINPVLKKYDLGFTQLIQNGGIETILFHTKSNDTIKSFTPIPDNVSLKGMNEYQVLGSAITYIRRYALSSMLGIVTDKDTDAATPKQIRKPVLNAATPAFEKALKFVRDGGSISAIEGKYSVSNEVKALLKL
jgi:hypothetical protein